MPSHRQAFWQFSFAACASRHRESARVPVFLFFPQSQRRLPSSLAPQLSSSTSHRQAPSAKSTRFSHKPRPPRTLAKLLCTLRLTLPSSLSFSLSLPHFLTSSLQVLLNSSYSRLMLFRAHSYAGKDHIKDLSLSTQ